MHILYDKCTVLLQFLLLQFFEAIFFLKNSLSLKHSWNDSYVNQIAVATPQSALFSSILISLKKLVRLI